MYLEVRNKIESMRGSRETFWVFLVLCKDYLWFFLKIINTCYSFLLTPYTKWRAEKDIAGVFSDIYKNSSWGGKPGQLYSGSGSHVAYQYVPYVDKIIKYLKSHRLITSTIVDLGCGDFNVGKHFIPYCHQYIGVDIVPALINKHNNSQYPDYVKFYVVDIIKDELPDGDIAFVRQVLQHLSNKQISMVLLKLKKYKTIFISEHHPSGGDNTIPNKDIISGKNTRFDVNSGVYLDEEPFSLLINSPELILKIPVDNGKEGYICTYKIENNTAKHL